jgi:hypothetical protein
MSIGESRSQYMRLGGEPPEREERFFVIPNLTIGNDNGFWMFIVISNLTIRNDSGFRIFHLE